MSPWEANLQALGRHHPAVADLVQGLRPVDRGQWSLSRTGWPTVRRDGVWWASAFDPQAEARKAVPAWDESLDVVILPGLGAGYLAEAVSDRYPDLPLVVAEDDPLWFAEVLAHRDLSALWARPGVVPLVGDNPGAVGAVLGPLACGSTAVLPWRPLSRAWDQAVSDQVVQARAQARVNLDTYRRFSGLWKRNLAQNEARARDVRPVAALAGWAAGRPAVVAAAGPTLADQFDWLRAHRHQYVLVAVDTAWPSLARQGLAPDVLLVLDGQYWNARHVDLCPPETTLVVTEWTGPPRAFRLAPGRTYVAATSLPFLRPREEARWGALGALPSGGSVATAAWSLALLLGCREVAFAGLDLGYPRGQTHVPGSQFEEALHRLSSRLVPSETLGLNLRGLGGLAWRPSLSGEPILSDPRMDLFRTWISAAVASRPDIRAVNLGTRGTVIPGLQAPPSGYGDDWAPARLPPVGDGPLLGAPRLVLEPPPFPALAGFLASPDFPSGLEEVWQVAEAYWGPAWDRWAGRARRTWELWPSARSGRALAEVVSLALDWEGFWDPS